MNQNNIYILNFMTNVKMYFYRCFIHPFRGGPFDIMGGLCILLGVKIFVMCSYEAR